MKFCKFMWWWWWLWLGAATRMGVGVVRAVPPCMPGIELQGTSVNYKRPWKYVTWQPMKIKATTLATVDCPTPPPDLKYCWYVSIEQGAQPSSLPCDIVAECKYVTGPVLQYDSYMLLRANYTVQVAAMVPGLAPRCVTGFFVVPPTPRIPLYFSGGPRTFMPHGLLANMFLVGGGRDPDKPPGSDLMKLEITWYCYTDDVKAQSWCNGDLSNTRFEQKNIISDASLLSDYKSYALGYVTLSDIRNGYMYNLSVKARELEWPYRTVEISHQERQFVNTGPSPSIIIKCSRPCELMRVSPTEELKFEAFCYYKCIPGVEIMYKWTVAESGKPVDLTKHSRQGRSKGVNMNKLTILRGTFKAGSQITVSVKAHYYPRTPAAKQRYREEYWWYKDYQESRRP